MSHEVDCDVLICGDDPTAREVIVGLAGDMPALRACRWMVNSTAAEALTSVLISIKNVL